MRYQFKIEPVAASRPRVTKWATYYPKKYTQFREDISVICRHTNFNKIDEGVAIKVTMLLCIPMPKSWSKKKRAEHLGKYKVTKPDNDNYEKAVYDALNGHAWHDDSQIAWNDTKKIYAEEGEIIVVVEALDN